MKEIKTFAEREEELIQELNKMILKQQSVVIYLMKKK